MQHLLSLLVLATSASCLPPPTKIGDDDHIIRGKSSNAKRQSAIIPVVVGGPQDTFVPNSISAAVGDVVQFQFNAGNHTVTQSTADAGCQPMEGGVHSGHIPFEDGQTDVGTFNMPVTSADPMFIYCATGPHCQEGQVMVINPTNPQQVVDYVKTSMATESSVDGTDVVGGTQATIPIDQAGFDPAPPEEDAAAPPPAEEAPPAEGEAPPAEEEAPAEGEAPAEEAPPAEGEAPPAEEEAPAEGEAPAEEAPAEGEAPPAEGEAPAEEAAPAEGEMPAPAEGEMPAPAEGEMPAPTEGEMPAPAEGEMPAPAADMPAPA